MDLATRAMPLVVVALAGGCFSPGGGTGADTGDADAVTADSGDSTDTGDTDTAFVDTDSGDTALGDSGDSGPLPVHTGDTSLPPDPCAGDTGDTGDTGNTPPGPVTLGPMTPYPVVVGRPITCNATFPAVDAEGDTVLYEVTFTALRTHDPFDPEAVRVPIVLRISPLTTSLTGPEWTVSSALTQFGDLVYCSVTAVACDGARGPTVDAEPLPVGY